MLQGFAAGGCFPPHTTVFAHPVIYVLLPGGNRVLHQVAQYASAIAAPAADPCAPKPARSFQAPVFAPRFRFAGPTALLFALQVRCVQRPAVVVRRPCACPMLRALWIYRHGCDRAQCFQRWKYLPGVWLLAWRLHRQGRRASARGYLQSRARYRCVYRAIRHSGWHARRRSSRRAFVRRR